MKNPFRHRGVTPALLFVQFGILLTFGIISIADSQLSFSMIQWVAGISFIIAGISRGWGLISDKRRLHGILTLSGFCLAGVGMLLYPVFVAASAGRIFGLWFLITGIAHATICVQCITSGLRGKVRNGLSALFSLIFGVLLLLQPNMQMKNIFLIAGIYMILFSVFLLVDAISEILLFGTKGEKFKRRIRISLPLFLTALLPGKLLDDFNLYFNLNPKEAAKLLQRPDIEPGEKTDVEIFIHLSDRGTQRTGHVDLRYLDTVFSYGCYDYHAHKFAGLVSDGTMVICDSKKYIEYCIRAEEKILVGFGLSLTEQERAAVEREIRNITENLVEWKSDYELGTMNREHPDAASQIIMETGCKIYKMDKGPFRKYYTLNTNCVKLADEIIGSSGIGLVSVNGIAIPGAYYSMLNDLYEKSGTIVTERNIYKELPLQKRKENKSHAKTTDDRTGKN